MIGIDTNVLTRSLVDDDPVQSPLARKQLLESCTPERPGFIAAVTLCELSWVLRSRYRYSREQLATVIEQMLNTAAFRVEHGGLARAAIQDYRAGDADFADYFVGHLNHAEGCEATLTFDRDAARHPLFRLLT